MKTTKGYLLLLCSIMVLLAVVLSGCSSEKAAESPEKTDSQAKAPAEKPKSQQISIGTASTGGSFYPIGVGIADVLTKHASGINAVAEQTGGAVENINLLNKGDIDIGFAPAISAKAALKGAPPFQEKSSMVMGWQLFNTPVHIVALAKSKINTVYDLKGKRISLGTAGSAGNATGKLILAAHGITEKDFTPVYLGWDESADSLGDGQIDAILVMSAIPSGSVQGLAAKDDITLVTVDRKAVEENMKDTGAFPIEVKAGTYKGQAKDIIMIDTATHAWLRPDLPEETVYNMLKAVMENKEYLKTVHPQAGGIAVMTKAEAELLGVTVHPGAIKYAKEIGVWEK